MAQLQRTWVVTAATTNGKNSAVSDDMIRSSLTFEGETVVVKSRQGQEITCSVKLDASRSPRTMRMETIKPDNGRKIGAIYVLGNDSLKLAWFENAANSIPEDFETLPQPPASLMVLDLLPKGKAPKANAAVIQAEEDAQAESEATQNLKMIGLAMRNYHEANNHFPPAAIRSADGKPLLSWRVAILPHLGEPELYNAFKLDEPWDSPANKPLLARMPRVFAPRDPTTIPHATYYQVFVGPGTVFEDKKGTPLKAITDPFSDTILAVQGGEPVPWTKPEDIGFTPGKPLPRIAGLYKGGTFLAVMADGSIQTYSDTSKPGTVESAIVRNDSERAKINPAGD